MTDKRVCVECRWTGLSSEQLEAPNPFLEDDILVGCPKCRSITTVRVACDEPGCWNESTIGEPTTAGYRNVCGVHASWNKKRKEAEYERFLDELGAALMQPGMDEDEVALAQRTVE